MLNQLILQAASMVKNKLRDHLDRLSHNREARLHIEVLCIDPPAKDSY